MNLLKTQGLVTHHGELQALYGLDLVVAESSVVSLIGANGAGKSTTLETIAGLCRASSGQIEFCGESIEKRPAPDIARLGVALVPEGRRLFRSLTIEENLLMGSASRRRGYWNLAKVYNLFPVLQEKRNSPAMSLSGGQQQMAAIGRALMANPRLLLCDEISLGLSPAMVREIYAQLTQIRELGTSLVIVEQNIALALEASDYVYCLREGRIVLEGLPESLSQDAVSQAYFGLHAA